MFWDKWIPRKYLIKSEICAVELCYTETGLVYNYTQLRNKNNKLEIIATGSNNKNFVLPETIFKNKIPLALILNGKGIIIKKISLNENSEQDPGKLISLNLPSINLSDFYTQFFKQNDNTAFISLCRRELYESSLIEFKNKKYELAKVLIGSPSIIGLEPLWNNYNLIPTSLHQAELTNGSLDSLSPYSPGSKTIIKIGDLSVDSTHTLGLAAGLSYFMQKPIATNQNEFIDHIERKHTEGNKFRFLVVLVVSIAFFLAIVNVLFYSSFFDKNNKLETELSLYQGKYEQINELLSNYQKNKDLIENAGLLNKNKLSEYADRIGKTLPDEVVLSELYFNPKKEKESEDSLVTFENKNLVLRGNCSKSFIVNEWINILKMQKFIKTVSLEKFIYNNEGILPNFEINLITE